MTMSLFHAINISATNLEAQTIRLNTVSSNLANANSVSGTEEGTYKPLEALFAPMLNEAQIGMSADGNGVKVTAVVESTEPANKEYMPGHPLADDDGFIYTPAVDQAQATANMMDAKQGYKSSVEAINTAKALIMRTLTIGR